MQIDSHTHPYTHGQYALVYTVCHAHKKKKFKKFCGLFLTTHTHVHSCISFSELQIPYKLTGWRRVSEEQHRTSNCSHGSVKTGGQNRSFSSQKRCLWVTFIVGSGHIVSLVTAVLWKGWLHLVQVLSLSSSCGFCEAIAVMSLKSMKFQE